MLKILRPRGIRSLKFVPSSGPGAFFPGAFLTGALPPGRYEGHWFPERVRGHWLQKNFGGSRFLVKMGIGEVFVPTQLVGAFVPSQLLGAFISPKKPPFGGFCCPSSKYPLKWKSFNTSYLTDSYIIYTLEMESVSKITIFGLKMMANRVKSGLEKIFLKFLLTEVIFL